MKNNTNISERRGNGIDKASLKKNEENFQIASHCMECDDVITNPICSDCLAMEMRSLLEEHDPFLSYQIRGFNWESGVPCIRCGQLMNVCAYCFSNDIFDFVQEQNQELAP